MKQYTIYPDSKTIEAKSPLDAIKRLYPGKTFKVIKEGRTHWSLKEIIHIGEEYDIMVVCPKHPNHISNNVRYYKFI